MSNVIGASGSLLIGGVKMTVISVCKRDDSYYMYFDDSPIKHYFDDLDDLKESLELYLDSLDSYSLEVDEVLFGSLVRYIVSR